MLDRDKIQLENINYIRIYKFHVEKEQNALIFSKPLYYCSKTLLICFANLAHKVWSCSK